MYFAKKGWQIVIHLLTCVQVIRT